MKVNRKVNFQLVPVFGLNYRNEIGQERWGKLSKKIRSEANYVCSYCGEQHPEPHGTAAHEEWEYDDKNHLYYLHDIKCVCTECHHMVHIGFTEKVLGKDAFADAMIRYININYTKSDHKKVFEAGMKAAFEDFNYAKKEWIERSKYKWQLAPQVENFVKEKYGIEFTNLDMIEF